MCLSFMRLRSASAPRGAACAGGRPGPSIWIACAGFESMSAGRVNTHLINDIMSG